MNWQIILKGIYTKLTTAGFGRVSQDILEGQLSGGTGGEVFAIIWSKLKKLERENPAAFMVIKEEVKSLNEYARQIDK